MPPDPLKASALCAEVSTKVSVPMLCPSISDVLATPLLNRDLSHIPIENSNGEVLPNSKKISHSISLYRF